MPVKLAGTINHNFTDVTSILPTPIQSAGRRPQNQALLRIYIAYRALLSLLLLIMLFSPNTRQLVGSVNADLYAGVALAYLASSAPLLGAATAHLQRRQDLLLMIFLVDIVAMTLLSDASGGMSSGLPVLLVVTSAASAVLIRNRALATLVAALCVLAILLDTLRLISTGSQSLNALFPAGLLGLLIFVVSVLVQIVAQRLGRVEELARNRASDLYDLQRLNEQIVQHMKSGILLVSVSSLGLANAAAIVASMGASAVLPAVMYV